MLAHAQKQKKHFTDQNMKALILLVLFACQTSPSWQQRRFPNIAFIGRGYDIYRSNPRSTSQRVDPGYVSPVIEANVYDLGRLSGDDRYFLPDRIDAYECQSCQQSFQYHQLRNMEDLKRTSGTTVTASYDGVLFGAKTSSGQEEIVQTSYELNHVYIDAYASCSAYCASIRQYQFNASDLTENFQSAVHELCTGELSPQQFLWTFGTHYITKIKMGSLFWQRTAFTSEDWAELSVSTKINQNTFKTGLFHTWKEETTGSKEETYEFETFTAKSLSRDMITIGTELNRTSSWLYVSNQQPMPITFSIYPIISLMSRRTFPNEPNLHVKRQEIIQILENKTYCQYLLQIQGKDNDDCYGITAKQALAPAEKIPFVTCPDIFGGHFSNNFLGISDANHLTKELKCPDDYSRKELIQTQDYSGVVYYCTSGESYTNFGGMFSIITTRNCYKKTECSAQGLLICWSHKTTDVPSEGRNPGMSEARGWRTFGNAVNGNSKSCPYGFKEVLLGRYYVGNTGCCECNDEPIYIEVFACYNANAFVTGKSYVGGFYGTSGNGGSNPSTGSYGCPSGYSPHRILQIPGQNAYGYSCITNSA